MDTYQGSKRDSGRRRGQSVGGRHVGRIILLRLLGGRPRGGGEIRLAIAIGAGPHGTRDRTPAPPLGDYGRKSYRENERADREEEGAGEQRKPSFPRSPTAVNADPADAVVDITRLAVRRPVDLVVYVYETTRILLPRTTASPSSPSSAVVPSLRLQVARHVRNLHWSWCIFPRNRNAF